MKVIKCILLVGFMKDYLVMCSTDHDQAVDREMFDLNSSEPQIKHLSKMKAGSIMGKVSQVQNDDGGHESRLFLYDMDPVMPPYDNVYDDLVLKVPLMDKFVSEEDDEDENGTNINQSDQIKDELHDSQSNEETKQEASEGVDTDGVPSDIPLNYDDTTNGAEPSMSEESQIYANEDTIENGDMGNTEYIQEEMIHGPTTIHEESLTADDTIQEEQSTAETITLDNIHEIQEGESSNHQQISIEVNGILEAESIEAVEADRTKDDLDDNDVQESILNDQENEVERETIQTEHSQEDETVIVDSKHDIEENEAKEISNDNVMSNVDSAESEEVTDSENSVSSSDQSDISMVVDQSISIEDTKPMKDESPEIEGPASDIVHDSQSHPVENSSDAQDGTILDSELSEATHGHLNEMQQADILMSGVEEQDVPIDQLDSHNTDHEEEMPPFVEAEHEIVNHSIVNDNAEDDIENQIDAKKEAAIENETYSKNESPAEESDIYEYDMESGAKSALNNLANDDFISGLDDVDKFFEEVDPPDELDVGASGLSMQDVLVGQGVQIIKTRILKGIEQLKRISTELKIVVGRKWMTFKEFLDDHFDINIDDIVLSTIESFESVAEQYQNISEMASDKLSDLKDNLEGPYEMAKTFYDDELSDIVKKMKQALSKIGLLDDDYDEEEDKGNGFAFENFKIDSFDTEEMQRQLDETRSKLM